MRGLATVRALRCLAAAPMLLALGCAPAPGTGGAARADAAGGAGEAGDAAAGGRQAPADAFMAALASHCGQAFAGRVVVDAPEAPAGQPDPFADGPLVMHVRGCEDPARQLEVPFHVGADRSRTWVLTRTATGLQLKHDHRHQDGSPDAVTLYGGVTATPGSAIRQEFPVDAESVALFEANGLQASVSNTWAMEIEPGQRFRYELSRPGGRLFQVDFDLAAPVTPPPAPWGHDGP